MEGSQHEFLEEFQNDFSRNSSWNCPRNVCHDYSRYFSLDPSKIPGIPSVKIFCTSSRSIGIPSEISSLRDFALISSEIRPETLQEISAESYPKIPSGTPFGISLEILIVTP